MKGGEGMLRLPTIALSIFPALAFGREIPVQRRNERTVLRFERDWLRALVERDRATLDRILADDFIDSNWKGELRNKSQVLAGLSKLVPLLATASRCEDQALSGRSGSTRTQYNKRSNRQIMMRIRFTDVLLYRQGHWRAVATQEAPVNSR